LLDRAEKEGGAVVHAFVQARQTSTRFENKVYASLNGTTVLEHVVGRLRRSKLLDKIVIASPRPMPSIPDGAVAFSDMTVAENDVLGRFMACLSAHPCDYIVRITADCPLVDPNLVDFIIHHGMRKAYISNVLRHGFPDGADIEMIGVGTLRYLAGAGIGQKDREHVTWLLRRQYKLRDKMAVRSVELNDGLDYSWMKTSIDSEDDLTRVAQYESRLPDADRVFAAAGATA